MEKQFRSIFESIQKLIGLHRQLLDVVRMEREALIQADLKSIQEASTAKQMLIEGIKSAETERLQRVGELAMLWKKPLRELTVTQIAIAIQGGDLKAADQLRSANTALTVLIQRITEQNRDNQALVERSLEHIHQMKKNILGETVPRADTYTAQGQKSGGAKGARLFSKEA